MGEEIKKTISLDSVRFLISTGTFISVVLAIWWFASQWAMATSNINQNIEDIDKLSDKVDSQVQIIQEISVTVARSDEKINTVIELLKKND